MLPASNRGMGQSLNFPDVCKTPAPPAPFIPVPYPNLGMNMQAVPFSPFVSITFIPATNMGSMKVMTSGDEAGAMGGLITGAIKAPGRTTIGNPIVFVTGLPGNCLATPTSGNNMNAPLGIQCVPSQPIVSYTRNFGDNESAMPSSATRPQPLSLDQVSLLEEQALPASSLAKEREAVWACRLGERRSMLRIERFTTHCDREVFQALRAIGHRPEDELLIDLRQNPGGDATASLRLAGQFVEAGTELMRLREPDGDVEVLCARGAAQYTGPVIVVIDAASASASEVFAAALQYNQRAWLVGQQSFGKASVQAVRCDDEGRFLYGNVGEFFLPDGAQLAERGLRPCVLVDAEASVGQLESLFEAL